MKQAIPLLGLFLMLGGCPSEPATNNMSAQPTPSPTPAVAFVGDQTFSCQDDRLARAEWIVCGSAPLMSLDRQLAGQWSNAARGASQPRLEVQQEDRYDFEDRRNACADVKCIAAAYRYELRGEVAPVANDTPKPVIRTVVKKVYVRERPRRHHPRWDRGRPYYDYENGSHPDDNRKSCALVIGLQRAERLAAACMRGSGNRGQCSVLNSCEELRGRS